MAYCTIDDLEDQISEDELIMLTDDAAAGVVDTDIAAAAIAKSDALIDGYCGKRYGVPFTTVPDVIKQFSADIAIYNLFGRREGAPEDRRTRYKDAIDFLKGVARGDNSLGENDPDGSPADTNAPQISSSTRIFSRTKLMSGF